ncbi:MAG: PIG-L deacetylase family protein [Acidobacteriota bacterium]
MAGHTLLAVFAHPDDETSVGPLLARYAAEGHEVYLACVTSGQKGFRPHAGLPAGDELGAVRERELRDAARELGIHEPFLMGFQDQGISTHAAAEEVAAGLREIIGRTRAEVVVTWGPEGITGHVDHRMTSNIATIVCQQRGLLEWKPSKLYYVAFPESRFVANPNPLNRKQVFLTVSDELVTTEIDCRAYLDAGLAAIRSHKTQWRPERMEQVHSLYAKVFEGRVYLRLALSSVAAPRNGAREQSIFQGLD